jgi:SAM-dependent methyltransferase
VNFFHSLLHRIDRGWDPISAVYAQEYDKFASDGFEPQVLDRLSFLSGGLAGKRVLDLGGGPGHYSVSFAKLGAQVVWHDPSREYQKLARARAELNKVSLDFSLGHLEEAKKFGENAFDIVFCRVCWYYCRGDRGFGRLIYGLLKPGGVGFIKCNITTSPSQRGVRGVQSWLYERLWLKVGHPFPPRGRITALIHRHPVSFLEADYRDKEMDIVTFMKCQRNPRLCETPYADVTPSSATGITRPRGKRWI